MISLQSLEEKISSLEGRLREFMALNFITLVRKNAEKKAIWLKEILEINM